MVVPLLRYLNTSAVQEAVLDRFVFSFFWVIWATPGFQNQGKLVITSSIMFLSKNGKGKSETRSQAEPLIHAIPGISPPKRISRKTHHNNNAIL